MFLKQISKGRALQIIGTVNAYCALLAERAGAEALYVSGAGVANASYGIADLGLTTLEDVCIDVRRIRGATTLPILVDADTGWNDPTQAVRKLEQAGATACHLEDQVEQKRCGHRPNKSLVEASEMCQRIGAACEGRVDSSFGIMARTDAMAEEGLTKTIDRALEYVAAGADMIFAEAFTKLEDYKVLTSQIEVPVLANITEFGKTPLYSVEQLTEAGVQMVLYPLSGFRAMSKAAQTVYQSIVENGSQSEVVELMQTREELYQVLDYENSEKTSRSRKFRKQYPLPCKNGQTRRVCTTMPPHHPKYHAQR